MAGERSSYKRIILIAVLVGILSGLGSLAFFEGLKYASRIILKILGFTAPVEGQSAAEIAQWAPPEAIWLIIPVICFGGLVSGLIATRYAPEIEGAVSPASHALPALRSVLILVHFVTIVITSITIGSGESSRLLDRVLWLP